MNLNNSSFLDLYLWTEVVLFCVLRHTYSRHLSVISVQRQILRLLPSHSSPPALQFHGRHNSFHRVLIWSALLFQVGIVVRSALARTAAFQFHIRRITQLGLLKESSSSQNCLESVKLFTAQNYLWLMYFLSPCRHFPSFFSSLFSFIPSPLHRSPLFISSYLSFSAHHLIWPAAAFRTLLCNSKEY